MVTLQAIVIEIITCSYQYKNYKVDLSHKESNMCGTKVGKLCTPEKEHESREENIAVGLWQATIKRGFSQ